jgi:hypothetical protein
MLIYAVREKIYKISGHEEASGIFNIWQDMCM